MFQVKHVNKNFGKRKVLDDICLELENRCYGLLGPNGAGKTTLLRCILKLYPLKEGQICTDNKNIGYLPQKFGVFHELSVYDILYYFSTLKKVPKEERDGEIDRVLSLVNLEDRKKERMSRLSGGMLRRVGIAQTILGDPEILFFDEPTVGLDPEERARFKRLVKKIMEGKIVIISTHIVEDVESLCDRVIIMNEGKILENVTVDEACQFAGSEANANLEAGYLARIQGD